MTSFEDVVDTVRRQFFPQWDKPRAWSISVVQESRGSLGRCLTETKEIMICQANLTGSDIHALQILIHEIAHAVTNTGHGTTWRKRIDKAAARADELGMAPLAKALREEVTSYSDPENHRWPRAYEHYRGLRLEVFDNPGFTFEEALEKLLLHSSMSADLFLKLYRRARREYDKAKKIRGQCDTAQEACILWEEKYGCDPDSEE